MCAKTIRVNFHCRTGEVCRVDTITVAHSFEEERWKDQEATTLKGNPLTLIGPELKPGEKAPDFKLVDNGLKDVTLADTGRNVRIHQRGAVA